MGTTKIKIGDIVEAKFGNSAIPCVDENGKRFHINIGIWGIVTDITPNTETKQDEILVKLMFDATSSHTYKKEDLIVICSTNLVKETSDKVTLEQIKEQYHQNGVCMAEFLATTLATGLSIEEAFYMFIRALKWSDNDRFFWWRDVDDREELGENNDNYHFDSLILCRFTNKDDLCKRVESLGAKVLSIKETDGLDNMQPNGIPCFDASLILDLDPGEGEYSRLQMFYFIDRKGHIVITETNFEWE